ncbi:MAG: hypothetical protein IJP71_05700 [Lachnospiraceae bacterium]|nr:hypothetical protein [Lachnospiraceae bacterium]
MKKILLILSTLLLAGSIISCGQKTTTAEAVNETKVEETTLKETAVSQKAENEIKESVNHMTEREFRFDSKIKFVYTGDDDYIKAITDDMVLLSEDLFGDQGAVEIPSPRIVKIDDSDKKDVKIFGDFWIYGYQMYGTIFNTKNGGSNPGCYHLKDEDGKITVISKEFAEDGSNNWSSLVKICGGDEDLAKMILNKLSPTEDEQLRLEYASMYAKANNLKFSGIKDYGWPVILSSDISDAEFLYNFYSAYFYEIRQDDVLNDMTERIENLKSKYMTLELIKKMDEKSSEAGADMIINAQDVTDEMLDTLQVDDFGNGKLQMSYAPGTESATKINVNVEMRDGKKVIVDMNY